MSGQGLAGVHSMASLSWALQNITLAGAQGPTPQGESMCHHQGLVEEEGEAGYQVGGTCNWHGPSALHSGGGTGKS